MTSSWRIIGASVQGTSHQGRNVPCQDAHGYRVLPDGAALIAVADGAGSAGRSDEGAQCAVAAALDVGQDAVLSYEALLTEAFRRARQAVMQLATAENLSLRAFAATLTCAVASAGELAVGQIGDGLVVARGVDGNLFAAAQPQRGEYANETFFLTMDDALRQVQIQAYPQGVEALAVMTDGLMRLAMNLAVNEPHLPFFNPLLAFAARMEDEAEAREQLAVFLASERVCARTDDDKTLVLAIRITNE